MKLFNVKATCPKCGCGDVGSHYQAEVADLPHPAISSRLMVKEEHIERRCQECSFKWPEACCGDEWAISEEMENKHLFNLIQKARQQRKEGVVPKSFNTVDELLEHLNGEISITKIIQRLNQLLAMDQEAVQKLVDHRVPFTAELAALDEHLQLGEDRKAGLVGVLNYLLKMDDSFLVAIYEEGRIVKFDVIEERYFHITKDETELAK